MKCCEIKFFFIIFALFNENLLYMTKHSDIRLQKAEDFFNAVENVRQFLRKNGISYTYRMLLSIASETPAPRFYISATEAKRVIEDMDNGRPLKRKSEMSIRMYNDLYNLYLKELDIWGNIKKKKDIIYEIICYPAPCFYCKPETAMSLMKLYYENNRKKL